MALKTQEASVGVGLGLAAGVYLIYQAHLPSVADVRSIEADNMDLQKSRRQATIMSAVLVGGVGLLTGDATAFVIGGAMIVYMDWTHRHADQVSPLTGTATPTLTVPGMTAQSEQPVEVSYSDAMV